MRPKTLSISNAKVVKGILDKAVEVFNIPLQTLKGKDRHGHIQRVRMAVANIARVEKKVHYNTIAGVINRDRSSIYHYERNHDTWYITWKTYQRAYDLLYKSLSENTKPTLNKCQIKRLLKENEIKELDGTVSIIINSGTTEHKFTTDLLNFTAVIEKINIIFIDFEIDLDIQL